ncbi:hypothetical protein Cni_G26849 [Canna indica]|uniref:Glutaredoxin domain-containing protein n=1 Tax=Canna indica TaxID=4628 RepID=A0AAQ3L4J2_9LILI|nr:hypothetical protein Cni_G26849 [Canna indica]
MAAIAAAFSSQTLKALLAPRSSWTANGVGVARVLAAACRVPTPLNSSHAGPGRSGSATLVTLPRLQYKRPGSALSSRCFSTLSPEMKSTIDKVLQSHKVILFMKGTKDFPQCGFSNTVVQILKSLNVPFETLNILENEMLRQGMKEYSSWPTFPQLYINGEFFGGCDITIEAYKSGQLQKLLIST